VISGYLGLRKAKKALGAKAFLETWLAQVKAEDWTTSILKYFHGDMTAAQLLELATDNGKLTEAHAYIGMIQMFAGTPVPAKVHFNWVKDNGVKSFVEYDLALAELSRGAAPAKATPATTKKPKRRT
jgi:lipoprotein NlpI